MIPRTVLREIAQRRMVLFHWLPVAMACGVAIFFSQGWWVSSGLCVAAALAVGGYLVIIGWRDHAMLPWMVLFLCVALGGAAGMLRSYLISAPVLSYPYYGDIIGRVVQVDRSNSNAPRYTLDQLTLGPIPAPKTPHKIRVSVHGKTGASDAHIGDIIRVRGYISPPQGPVEPYGFDFRKYAYFLELGAVGYARDAPSVIGQTDQIFWFKSMQTWLSELVDRSMNPKVSGFAKALIAGDRSDMQTDVIADLLATNLAHLLAISGLHMGADVIGVFLYAFNLRHGSWPLGAACACNRRSDGHVHRRAVSGRVGRQHLHTARIHYDGHVLRCGHLGAARNQFFRRGFRCRFRQRWD